MEKVTINSEDLEKLKKAELRILKEFDRICRKYDIPYTLGSGTLIGAIRHQGFIPWDDDIDVRMMRADCIRFKEICQTELNEDFFYQSHDTDKEYYYLFDKIRLNGTVFKETFLKEYNINHGVYIDIFPLDTLPDSKIKRKIQYFKFDFFRTGLVSKYLNLDARTGKKKILAKIIRQLYRPFSLDFLYEHACDTAMLYNSGNGKYVHNFCSPFKYRNIFESDFYNGIECKFEGENYYIPIKYDEILRSEYGDYMQLPPENQRITAHEIVELDFGDKI